jgi:Uma2 family endonuclease
MTPTPSTRRDPLATVDATVPPLVAGDKLTRDEFLRRWEAMPDLKCAELIGGIVYMPSPLCLEHGDNDAWVTGWLAYYAIHTPGCQPAVNATWLMHQDAAQPDTCLRILPDYGGQSRVQGRYAAGAPEFLAEMCLSSTSYDLHQKLELYRSAGVQEYLAVLLREQEVRWHVRAGDVFEAIPLPTDGVYKSRVFPGLWLHAEALLANDMVRVMATLNLGLQCPEHAEFVKQLQQKRSQASPT